MDWCVLPGSVGAAVVKRLGKVGVWGGHGRWITKAREWSLNESLKKGQGTV